MSLKNLLAFLDSGILEKKILQVCFIVSHWGSSRPGLLGMGLLPDTQNCGLRMRRECRERFPLHR